MKISPAIVGLPRSGIRTVFELALTVPDAVHLEVGEPSFATPAHVVEAAHRAAVDGQTKYTPNAGIPELREAAAGKVRARNGLVVSADQVVVTSGAVAGLFSALAALAEPSDEILISDPSWPNYALMMQLLGLRAVRYPLQAAAGFATRAADIAPHVTPRTKAIVLNSPSNPCGAVTQEADLVEILELARRHDLWVLSDEVYDEIWFDEAPTSIGRFDDDGRVVTFFSMSKTYAMTGWRVGYLVAAREVAEAIIKCQEPITSCVNSPAQLGALAALTGDQGCVDEMRAAYRARRDLTTELMDDLGVRHVRPTGAFYVMVDISDSGLDGSSFARRLVLERKVAVAPGDTFGPGSAHWVRVSLASPEHALREGVHQLAGALHEWRADPDVVAPAAAQLGDPR